MNTLIGYIRINPTSSHSDLDWQRAAIEAWCSREHRPLPRAIYSDITSRLTGAPGWSRLLADVDAGRVETVLVTALDRLGRDGRTLERLIFLREAGIEVIVVS